MATVSYTKEKKQTISAMKGVIDYCSQDKKLVFRTTLLTVTVSALVCVALQTWVI